jgi:TrmH family RNA methyltransferase
MIFLQDAMRGGMQITSSQNPKLKQASSLHNRKDRDETGLFLIEGYREILRAVAGDIKIESLFYAPSLFLGTNEPALIEEIRKRQANLYECEHQVFDKLSYRDRPDGLVAVAVQMKQKLADLKSSKTPLYVVAETIEKPGNLGTILRSADAVKADGVIVCDRCTDIYNPNVVRASTGTLFTLPVVEATSQEVIPWLRNQNILIAAATPHAKIEFTDANLKGPLAIAVGTEQFGLSKLWLDAADIQVRIPMLGVADSLNVATATTLLLYEALRQRR